MTTKPDAAEYVRCGWWMGETSTRCTEPAIRAPVIPGQPIGRIARCDFHAHKAERFYRAGHPEQNDREER